MSTSNERSARHVLAVNLTKLMKASRQSQDAIGKRAGGRSQSTIDRMTGAEVSARIDNVEKVARVFGLHVWQLLVPNLDPKRLPRLDDLSVTERAVIDAMRRDVENRAMRLDAKDRDAFMNFHEAGTATADTSSRKIATTGTTHAEAANKAPASGKSPQKYRKDRKPLVGVS